MLFRNWWCFLNLSETFSHTKIEITYHGRQAKEEEGEEEEEEEGKEIESPSPFIYSV